MLITSVRNSGKLIRTFIRQFLKGNSMGPIKIHNGGNYAHAQDYKALITSVSVKIQLNKNVHWTVFEGQQHGINKNS